MSSGFSIISFLPLIISVIADGLTILNFTRKEEIHMNYTILALGVVAVKDLYRVSPKTQLQAYPLKRIIS